MKYHNLLVSVALSVITLNAFGQDTLKTYSAEDTTEINLKKALILIIDKEGGDAKEDNDETEAVEKYKHWSGVFFGVNTLINDKNSIAPPAGFPLLELNHARSFQTQVNLFEKQFELGSPHAKFITGLGMTSNTMAFKKSTSLVPGTDSLAAFNTGISYNRNRLSTTSFTIPMMFGFNTHKDKSGVHLALGVIGSVNAWVNTYQKYSQNGEKHVVQINNDFNLNRWNVSAISTLGFGKWLTLYAQYQINPYFEKNPNNPVVHNATIGLRVIPF